MSVRTYSNYLKLDELLGLQQPKSDGPEHDEILFIVIHQVYELWFKEVLHEVAKLQRDLVARRTSEVLGTFKRVLTIFKTLVAQVDVLETMTPVSFSSFRARLDAASGFQSCQFRELEIALGLRRAAMLEHMPEETPARRQLEQRMGEMSLYEAFLRYLAGGDYAIPEELLERDRRLPPVEDERVREVLVEIYQGDPTTRDVCERMVDLDEGLQEWRYRHVKMVERTIGSKRGTGGSAGAAYLRKTLFAPLFPDLWAIRTEL
jgi:tryptophan 2,3-dioxygenase